MIFFRSISFEFPYTEHVRMYVHRTHAPRTWNLASRLSRLISVLAYLPKFGVFGVLPGHIVYMPLWCFVVHRQHDRAAVTMLTPLTCVCLISIPTHTVGGVNLGIYRERANLGKELWLSLHHGEIGSDDSGCRFERTTDVSNGSAGIPGFEKSLRREIFLNVHFRDVLTQRDKWAWKRAGTSCCKPQHARLFHLFHVPCSCSVSVVESCAGSSHKLCPHKTLQVSFSQFLFKIYFEVIRLIKYEKHRLSQEQKQRHNSSSRAVNRSYE